MKQQGKLTLASGKALLAAKSEGEEEKKKKWFQQSNSRSLLVWRWEVVGAGGQWEPLACGVHPRSLLLRRLLQPRRGRARAASQGGGHAENK